MNYVRNLLENGTIRHESILDIGCWNDGFPRFAGDCIKHSNYYIGIDKDFEGIDEMHLKERLLGAPVGLDKANIDANWRVKFELNYLDLSIHILEFTQSFDLILVINVLHFFEESKVQEIIDSCNDLLKPGGSIIAQISNRDREDYIFFKNEEGFKQLFIKKGLELVYADSCNDQVIVHFCKPID
ncbi:hypothetical protein GCM10009122_58630 [Fulvivirga kasyanovii]|uniref:class I SAM-dependent methyltransferase n=1 Tax=Fulvivirga kasyanovii TaxID=396812 RepID=UPI0031DEA84D